MRRLSIIPPALLMLLASGAAGPAAPARSPGSEGPSDPRQLRERLDQTRDRAEWDRLAGELLAALDAGGAADSGEADWIVSRLLESRPNDPALLWRRADQRRRNGADDEAAADMEALVRAHPGHPLAVRARRALPSLYLKLGMHARSARADEALLREQLADPAAVLTRLARSYALMSQPVHVRETLARLEALDADRIRFDPTLSWLAAQVVDQLDEREVAAERLLEFANLFPNDAHRAEALLGASQAYHEIGSLSLALALGREAVDTADDSTTAERARLLLGQLYERAGDRDAARREYGALLAVAIDPQQAASALQRLVDLEVEQRGTEAALLMLGGLARSSDGFTDPLARLHVERLMAAIAERIGQSPADAAFYHRLAERLGLRRGADRQVIASAGELWESVGAGAVAGGLYRSIASEFPAESAAERELAQALARTPPYDAPENDPVAGATRLAALARHADWESIELQVEAWSSRKGGFAAQPRAARAVAAHAALRAGRADRALSLLSGIDDDARALMMKGDAQAVIGNWDFACDEYRRAADLATTTRKNGDIDDLLLPWVEVRLARCEYLAGQPVAARTRLDSLLATDPADPVAFAAHDLQAVIDHDDAGDRDGDDAGDRS